MAEWFASGRLVDLILALVVVEVIVLALYWRATRRGVPPADLLPNILAGAFLLLALRLSLGGFGWQPCCACLAAAGVAHLVDLRRRWM
ncbi:MAG: hypothetical protein ABWY64_11290 [Tardiphaga sp.]